MRQTAFMFAWSVVERLAHEGRQRILDGLVDERGYTNPVGPRKQLTAAQARAHADMALTVPFANAPLNARAKKHR